jgi:hypothetical protein
MRYLFRSYLLVPIFLFPVFLSAETFKVEPANALPEGVPSSLSVTLQSPGINILDQAGKTWCELWLRKELPKASQAAGANAKYPDLHTGLMVGIMRFPSEASDYRGQTIKAGTYSLRYALIPQDGNHMGASPIRDFLLLTPAAEDSSGPDAEIAFDELMKMSRKTTGANHPGVILMGLPPESAEGSALFQDDMGHWIYKAQVPLKPSGHLWLAIVVYGKTEG